MARRDYWQKSFADVLVRGRQRKCKRLERLATMLEIIDWKPIERILSPIHASTRGAEGYPPLSLFKALLLAVWYDLSDPQLKDAIADRMSFRKFVGIPLDEETPDETTFVRFRDKLRARELFEKLFAEINRQLEAKGPRGEKRHAGRRLDRRGVFSSLSSLCSSDASCARRPSEKEGQVSDVDPDATFTKKQEKSYFGYKIHVGVDEGSGLIRKVEGTTASVHDSQVFAPLISGDEEAAGACPCEGGGRQGLRLEGQPRLSRAAQDQGPVDAQGGAEPAAEALAEMVQQGGGGGTLGARAAPSLAAKASMAWRGPATVGKRA